MALDNKFIFAEGNQPRCEIIVRDEDDEISHAANLLKREIETIADVKRETLGSCQVEMTNTGSNLSQVEIGTLSSSPEMRDVLEKDKILSISGDLELLLASTASTHIFIPADLGEQGFVIHKTSEDNQRLLLTGNTTQACLYAVSTLIDRLHMEGDRLIVDKLNTRLFPAVNIPAFEYRSVATNIGGPDWLGHNQWAKEWGNQDEYDYRGFIDWLASHKINHLNMWLFNLAFGIAYDSERFPECVNRHHPNVKNEFISDMIEYAHKRHIEIFVFVDFPDNWTAVVKAHPYLSVDDYAHLYVIKRLRRKDRELSRAYAHYIKAIGLKEMLDYSGIPEGWRNEEDYQSRFDYEVQQLRRQLDSVKRESEFATELRNAADTNSP